MGGAVETLYGRLMLRSIIFLSCLFWIFLAGIDAVSARSAVIETEGVVVCPASADDTAPPDFTGANCSTMTAWDIDPQNAYLWVKGKITLKETQGENGEPLALFVLGKMSSAFYLNGQYVGANGTPAADAASEIPGRMDAAIYPPQPLFREGENEIVFKASSHRGFLSLRNPIHGIFISQSANITNTILRGYWPAPLTLGLFLAGALYFAITGVNARERKRAWTFSIICAFAAAQLMAEISRGLVAYAYPFHDIRLLLITAFSAGFGLSVAYHVFSTFSFKRTHIVIAVLAGASLIGIWLAPGFDMKAAIAIIIPLAASLIATGVWTYRRRPRAFAYFLSLLVFLIINFAFPHLFLDVLFFYLVAAFLLFLFVEQGFALVREADQRRIEQARADRLELALDQAKEREEATTINVKSAGKMERISTDQIAHCRGASGYSEIVLEGGREILHTATLTDMETTLPATFLRVHRSHLVNTSFVKTLQRDPAGTGTLVLSDGSEIPVSRRVMPKVRQALG